MMHRKCKSCGDIFDIGKRKDRMSNAGQTAVNGELEHCKECADELFRGTIRNNNVTFFGGPGGHYGAQDNNPGQDNAIRSMEGE